MNEHVFSNCQRTAAELSLRGLWPLAAIIGLAFSACAPGSSGTELAGETQPAPSIEARVSYEHPKAASELDLLHLPAEVVLPPHARHELAPAFAGRLVAWLVKPGEETRPEQAIAELISTDLSELEAAERELSEVVAARKRIREAQQKHVDAGMQSIQSVYDADLALAEARAQLGAVRRQLAALKELGAAHPQGTTGDRPSAQSTSSSQWLSSVQGVVESMQCAPGTVITPDVACLSVIDTSLAELRVDIPEAFLPRFGEDVRARWLPAGSTDTPVEMRLLRRSSVINPRSRTLSHFFRPDGELPASMKSGATGRVTLVTPTQQALWRIPRNAGTRLDGKPVVFVRQPEPPGFAPLEIQVMGHYEHDILIAHQELSEDSEIATRGVFLLKSMYLLNAE